MTKKSFEKNIITNDVILKAQNGDLESREFIVGCFTPLVLSLINKYHIPGYTTDDLIQHCNLALLNCIRLFKFSGYFPAYVKMALVNNLSYLCRNGLRHEPPLSLNVQQPDGDVEFIDLIADDSMSIEDEFIREASHNALMSALEYLDSGERHLINYLLINGVNHSLKTYSNEFNLSYGKCRGLKRKAFSKLRNILKNFNKY
ncbi:MAG: sigma-70 family RNA polymerase sigma factor [Clostridium sp.]